MPELLLLFILLIPQIFAGVFANSMGRNFWFLVLYFFLIPIISLIVLLLLNKNKDEGRKSYELAGHVKKRE